MNEIAPCRTFDLVTPMPEGYEERMAGVTILAVDPKGIKPILYFSFPERTRGWHPWPLPVEQTKTS